MKVARSETALALRAAPLRRWHRLEPVRGVIGEIADGAAGEARQVGTYGARKSAISFRTVGDEALGGSSV